VKVLLDTCTFLWLIDGSPSLSDNASAIIRDPVNEVRLSVVSHWEIALKHAKGKLPLEDAPAVVVREQCEAHGISILPLHSRDVARLDYLAGAHKDPFDRMIVCQAIERGLVLLTPDPLIRQYPVTTRW
jgi:PIN domain nuclease of toxin-antitoxin system